MHDWNLEDPFLRSWVLMGQAFEAAYRAMEVELLQYRMTFPQYNVLMLLDCCTVPLSPGQISSYVFREKHTVSTLLSRMEKTGLIEKTKDGDDDRVVKAQITPKGRMVLKKVMTPAMKYARELMAACFTEDEVKNWDRHLRKLRDHSLQELGQGLEPLPPIFQRKGLRCSCEAAAIHLNASVATADRRAE